MTKLLVLAVLAMAGTAMAFVVQSSSIYQTSSLNMVPRFDKQSARWIPSSPEEDASSGYDAVGSLLRQGPAPFFQRIVNADEYDQAVLKFMAGEGCSRNEAQASMDAYLRNPNDWAYDRMEEQKTGRKVDYLTLQKDKVALTLVWTAIVLSSAARLVYSLLNGENFWAFVRGS